MAALTGAGLIGVLPAFLYSSPVPVMMGLLITIMGFTGSLFDSPLSATVQAIYFCLKDQKRQNGTLFTRVELRLHKSEAGNGWITTESILHMARLG